MGERLVAQGADRFRAPGVMERTAARLSRLRLTPALRRGLKRVYERALMLQTGGRGLRCALPGGESVRVLPEYAHVSWNPDEYRAFRAAVGRGATVLDVGANVGAYALLFGGWTGPSGSVFAFEPAPDAFLGLCRHVDLNGLAGHVRPVQTAVGDSVGSAPFVNAGTHGEGRLACWGDEGAAAIDVAVTTIDAFCAEHGLAPQCIKIDVEGAELAVLRGARETIRRCRGNLALFVEMHPTRWAAIGVDRHDVLAELEAQALDPLPLVPPVSPAAADDPLHDHLADDPLGIEGIAVRLQPR